LNKNVLQDSNDSDDFEANDTHVQALGQVVVDDLPDLRCLS